MTRRSHAKLNKDQEYEAVNAFKIFDVDNSNMMDEKELKQALRALGFDVSKEEVAKIMAKKDKEGKGNIDIDAFKEVCAIYMSRRDPRLEIMRAFQLFDTDHDGFVDIEDLKKVSAEMNDEMSAEDLEQMITKFDKDKDGKINLDEFMNIMDPTHSCH